MKEAASDPVAQSKNIFDFTEQACKPHQGRTGESLSRQLEGDDA
jgi:hypothetical protein